MFDELNRLGKSRTPLLFVIDYDMKNYYISPLCNLDPDIRYSIDKRSDFKNKTIPYHYKAVSKQRYEKAFNTIQEEIK